MKENEHLEMLRDSLRPVIPVLIEATERMINQEVTDYPIFVIHKEASVALGVPLVNHESSASDFSIHISSLEELNAKMVIPNHKVESFREVYKDPSHWLCLLFVSAESQQIIFLPKQV